ncbi:hypothetical protein LINPERPRIM_LOCUS17349 [Linum perenne]
MVWSSNRTPKQQQGELFALGKANQWLLSQQTSVTAPL